MISLVLFLLPLLAILLVLIIRRPVAVKTISLLISLVQLGVTMYIAVTTSFSSGQHLEFFTPWISRWSIDFHLCIDVFFPEDTPYNLLILLSSIRLL